MSFKKLPKLYRLGQIEYSQNLTHIQPYNSIQGSIVLPILFIGMRVEQTNWFSVDFQGVSFKKLPKLYRMGQIEYSQNLTHIQPYNSIQGSIVLPILFIGMRVEQTNWLSVDFHPGGGCELQEATQIVPN